MQLHTRETGGSANSNPNSQKNAQNKWIMSKYATFNELGLTDLKNITPFYSTKAFI